MQAIFTEAGSRTSSYRELVLERALTGCPLFAGLCPGDIAALVRAAWLKSLAPGELLFHQGDPGASLCVVQSGAVRLFRVNASGHEQVVHISRPRESFGEESIFTCSGHSLNAAAIQSTKLVVVPGNEFLALSRRSPELLVRIARAPSGHVREMVGLLDDLRLKSARARLANWLLDRCPAPESAEPHAVSLSIPKRVVASELGMASETFSRVLAEFQSANLLAVRGRTLVLLCPRQLGMAVSEGELFGETTARSRF